MGASDGLRSATQWCSASKQRDADKVCWQLSLETQQRAAYAGSADLQSMHASHAERAGRLRGGLGEAEGLVRCCRLACANSGQLRSCVNGPGTAGRQSESQSRKIGPVISETASVRLCCVENITRGAVETSYLYIRMGHTTYTHLNDTYRIACVG